MDSKIIEKLLGSIETKTSSGSSVVYIGDDSTVIQKFLSNKVAERIAKIMLTLLEKEGIKLPIRIQRGFGPKKTVFLEETVSYSPFSYIVPFEYYMPDQALIGWTKISPLNEKMEALSASFLEKNIYKLWYDISKALYALKTINVIHNDCVVDNIGIYKGNFVLFDFDGSGSPEEKGKGFESDYRSLQNSLDFRGVDTTGMDTISGINSVIEYVAEKENITIPEAFLLLENLTITN